MYVTQSLQNVANSVQIRIEIGIYGSRGIDIYANQIAGNSQHIKLKYHSSEVYGQVLNSWPIISCKSLVTTVVHKYMFWQRNPSVYLAKIVIFLQFREINIERSR